MLPVNPEAIGLFGRPNQTILKCFNSEAQAQDEAASKKVLEQVGVGVKGADHAKLTTSLGLIAILFGGCAQLFTALCIVKKNRFKSSFFFCMALFKLDILSFLCYNLRIYTKRFFRRIFFLACSGCWWGCSS